MYLLDRVLFARLSSRFAYVVYIYQESMPARKRDLPQSRYGSMIIE